MAQACFTEATPSLLLAKGCLVEPLPDFPDLASLPDAELRQLIRDLVQEENEVSYRRRLLHGRIDILRAELVARLQKTEGKSILDEVDVDRLTAILTAKAPPPEDM
jgi:hypothetical protein